MKLHQAIDGKIKQQTAIEKVYESSHFGSNFMAFLEALAMNGLIPVIYKRSVNEQGHLWNDEVRKGGISIVTTSHPILEQGNAGNVIVRGPKKALELFESVIKKYATFEGAEESDLEMDIEYHDELNPKLWTEAMPEEAELKEDVHTALKKAAKAFIEFLQVPKVKIQDITLTGSCANFNWTPSSDIDLHIVIDMEQAEEEYGELIKEYFDAKKSVWNDLHDITVKGIPVEFYVQASAEKHYSTGVYSLKRDYWVIEPKQSKPEIDDTAVERKAKEMMKLVDDAIATNKASVVERVMEKLRKMRKAGLEEAGEFSTENLAFKMLRNNGYLEKLADVRTKTFDRELSVEEEEWSYLKSEMAKLPVRQPYIHY